MLKKKIYFLFHYLFVFMCIYGASAHRGQRGASAPLDLELPDVGAGVPCKHSKQSSPLSRLFSPGGCLLNTAIKVLRADAMVWESGRSC